MCIGASFELHKLATAQMPLRLAVIYSSHLIVSLVVYLCTKFGAPNPRINEIRSCEIVLHAPPNLESQGTVSQIRITTYYLTV